VGNQNTLKLSPLSMPPLGGRPDTITVSGQSSGSIMSQNLHVIMSDTVKGAGLMQGVSYWTPDYFLNPSRLNAKDASTITQESVDKAEEY
jgi:hypothetical protein